MALDTKGWPTGQALYDLISQDTDRVMLAFSAGKDSVGAWLALRPHFKEIIPVFKYLVPGLGFIEEGLAYYERFFGTKIVRVPHESLYRMLGNMVFQPPERRQILEDSGIGAFSPEDARDWVADDFGLPSGTWIAVGVRAVDSPQRLMAMRTHGPRNFKRKVFYPVWDWNKRRLLDTIREAGCQLPKEYRIFGRSFDGLDFRFLFGIRQHFPKDYERILHWFPLAHLEIKRYEFIQNRGKVGHDGVPQRLSHAKQEEQKTDA